MELLVITGFSASGKTTIAQEVNSGLGYVFSAERKILHDLAVSHGFEHTRQWLAEVGLDQTLVEARRATVDQIHGFAGIQGVIIDGGYDRNLPDLLGGEFPRSPLVIVSIKADIERREHYMAKRLGSTLEVARQEMTAIDTPKKLAGVEEVMEQADIVVCNNGTLGEATKYLTMELQRRGIVFYSPY